MGFADHHIVPDTARALRVFLNTCDAFADEQLTYKQILAEQLPAAVGLARAMVIPERTGMMLPTHQGAGDFLPTKETMGKTSEMVESLEYIVKHGRASDDDVRNVQALVDTLGEIAEYFKRHSENAGGLAEDRTASLKQAATKSRTVRRIVKKYDVLEGPYLETARNSAKRDKAVSSLVTYMQSLLVDINEMLKQETGSPELGRA